MDAKQEVLMQLATIIREHLWIEEEKITEKSTWAQLGADSLDRLEMSQVLEDAFQVSIPHVVGERLDTIGETVEHLLTLTAARRTTSNIQIEAATTDQQWAEMSVVRTQVFTSEHGFSPRPLPGPGARGVWHFVARNNHDAVGTLSIVDTTGNRQLHERYHLNFGENERVARYTQLAILKPYRKCGIFEMLMESALSRAIRPNGFTFGWLLYPAPHARSAILTQSLGFTAVSPLLTTEFGNCHALIRREPRLQQVKWTRESAQRRLVAAAK